MGEFTAPASEEGDGKVLPDRFFTAMRVARRFEIPYNAPDESMRVRFPLSGIFAFVDGVSGRWV